MNSLPLLRLGVLGSGKGSNFVAIADACSSGSIPATVAVVLSDVPNAGILQHATTRGIPTHYVAPGPFRTKLDETAEQSFVKHLLDARVDWVVLAGFMRILKGGFLKSFPDRVVNIHPSLLPSFPGLAAWKQALDHGVRYTGCTVHLVDQGIDTGAILGQAVVPVMPGDTSTSLHERIQEAERSLYPGIIGQIARGQFQIRGRVATLSPGKT